MSYQLVLIEKPTPAVAGKPRDVGENVFLNNIPSNYKVYLFYYPGSMGNDALEGGLRKLGEKTGHNLFVNIGQLDDPDYDTVTTRFEMKTLPAIVITAVSDLASLNNEYLSAYARLDSKQLLKSPEKTLQCVLEIFNLFLQGKVSEALAHAQSRQRAELLKRLGGLITDVLKPLLKFIDERDISFSLFEGKFELKKAGG
jgi:hypothetical protein